MQTARPTDVSRRAFLQFAAVSGVTAVLTPLAEVMAREGASDIVSPDKAFLQDTTVGHPPQWFDGTRARFRRDGIPKVTGEKVFAIDVRARDMPGWPREQSHAMLLRVPRADRIFEGIDLSILDADLVPDVIVTAEDLARDHVEMVEADFYGELLLATGETPVVLGQAVALLIWHDYNRYRLGKRRLKFNDDAIRWGRVTGPVAREPYGGARFVRVSGTTPEAPDRYSALRDAIVFAEFDGDTPLWPTADASGDAAARALHHAQQLRRELDSPGEGVRVWRRQYLSQYVDPAALETDNGNAWYDQATSTLHVVTGTQSPYTNAQHIMTMVKRSHFALGRLNFHPGYTVGYGQKEHHAFPYYVAVAALYGDGHAVRLAQDRHEHFQSAIKRHPFHIDTRIAVDERTGRFMSLASDLTGNGGGRMNFSPSVGQVAATALQSIYYFPRNDIAVSVRASRAPLAGSMRGYGTLQAMVSTELLVDEIAHDLGIDAIELRRRNLLRAGMKNTQGAIPAGALRSGELLDAAQVDPLWQERVARKAEWEAAHPGHLYGVGFSCVHKDYGTGAEAALALIEFDPAGKLHMRHVASEIGCGATTSQMLVPIRYLGRPADTADFAAIDWPSLQLDSNDEPYTMTQGEQDRAALDPHWVPRITSPRSASNSAYYFSHATLEAARALFELGLWPAALSIWQEGVGGGQAAPLFVRREDAVWHEGRLIASGLKPLEFGELAARAHEFGFVTGVTVHTFNRWAWASASFEIDGRDYDAPIDAMSVRWGTRASDGIKASTRDAGYVFQPRKSVKYPPVQRNNASVVYYAPVATLVELAVNSGSGQVTILSHRSWLDCGTPIVPELVSGQLQGGIAMGIGHALYEELPLYEDGPGNGTWNFNRYRLPRASDVAVWSQQGHTLAPLSPSDPAKGIAEVVMIPIVAAIGAAVHMATGRRLYEFPLTAARIRESMEEANG